MRGLAAPAAFLVFGVLFAGAVALAGSFEAIGAVFSIFLDGVL